MFFICGGGLDRRRAGILASGLISRSPEKRKKTVSKKTAKPARAKAAVTFSVSGTVPHPRKHSLAERAYLEIRNQILKGELPVGMALARRKLAAQLGVSVPPVGEALQRLESEGLVESKPRVGTRVRIPTRQDIEDRSVAREALETQAARLFSERATAAEKQELQQMGRRVDLLYAACEHRR